MNCAYHADREVQGICSRCGRPICADCLVDLGGQVHCKTCLEALVRKPPREVNGTLRFVLSAVPGLGHLYMGLFNRGVQLMVGTVIGSFLLNMLLTNSPIPFFFGLGMVFFSIFDAREAYLRIQQGLEVEDKGFVDLNTWKRQWDPKYVGYALIGVGGLALYNTLLQDGLRLLFGRNQLYYDILRTINGAVLGGLAILTGLYMLRKGFGRSEGQ